MAVINTNIMTMNAQRNLSRSQSDLSQAVQRLSSGLRINSAKDDAAGLAISSRMGVQISGLTVAVRNANDAISISQTAEGAMDEMTRALTRANDLAIQAASYNTAGDRASLNNEVSELIQEMGRIVNQTRYNGERILSGGFSADVQVGVKINETINVSVGDLSTAQLGVSTSFEAVEALSAQNLADRAELAYTTALAGTETIAGSKGTATLAAVAANSNSIEKIEAINAVSAQTGVEAFGYGNAAVGGTGGAQLEAGALSINGVTVGAGAGATLGDTVAAINAVSDDTGVTASIAAGGGNLVLTNTTGAAITVSANANGNAATGFANGTTVVDEGANGIVVLNDTFGTANVGFDAAGTGDAVVGVNGASVALADAAVNRMSVDTVSDANLALLAFGKAIDTVNENRSELGAKLNRLESTIRNIENVTENISAAQSRIQDADFAKETAKLTRAQILQQAGTAMVAQANQIPQSVLSLLQ